MNQKLPQSKWRRNCEPPIVSDPAHIFPWGWFEALKNLGILYNQLTWHKPRVSFLSWSNHNQCTWNQPNPPLILNKLNHFVTNLDGKRSEIKFDVSERIKSSQTNEVQKSPQYFKKGPNSLNFCIEFGPNLGLSHFELQPFYFHVFFLEECKFSATRRPSRCSL